MHPLLAPKRVPLCQILAGGKDDVGAREVDVQVAVFEADGAVAVVDCLRLR